ncbi:(2Fe-2S) ferredoxin domain-containing protein [Chloroflexus sp.]|uniref:(2Fe-2S) ferredoxin domain-containing protein n=1 Tax=Chloroflexus sp. TaxID=1904827 RepID=UPI00298EDD23|nr:(2Fe-2S) ferredoxin domain-containing protein [Chloroflexus sp.]MCS6886838.1 (2Fe-2S) ferredoxin domain-containing protein [Chloroflexus sp.]MDW8402839.1 (2Fe-2S) ferredoxin domain-containing protein [Chloroflexus sp.]
MPRLYLCMGPHCRSRGAADVYAALEQALWRSGLWGRVECIASGCHDRCQIGPNLLVQPGGRRWHGLTPPQIDALVAFLADTVV